MEEALIMVMQPDHFTEADPTKLHQVRFSSSHGRITVSCNCRMTTGGHEKAGKLTASPMGRCRNLEESRELYNNPANHWAPFTDEDKAKW